MLKHTQTIRRQMQTNCLSVFDHFVGFALKRLNCEKLTYDDMAVLCKCGNGVVYMKFYIYMSREIKNKKIEKRI